MVVKCSEGHENRVPDDPAPNLRYRCGRCKGPIEIVWASASPTHSKGSNKVGAALLVGDRGNFRRITRVPAVISIIFLLLAVLGKWPHGFYTLLRFAVCGTAVYLAWTAAMLNRRLWAWLMGGGAVLFNPFVPVRFDRWTWQAIDFIAALVFAASFIFVRSGRRHSR